MTEQGDSKNDIGSLRVIRIAPKERTPKEQRIIDINERVSKILNENLRQVKSLSDYISSYYALRMQFGGIAWMWDYGEQTEESVMEFFQNDGSRREADRDAKVVEELAPVLQAEKGDPSSILVLLKRIRDKHGRYQYGILAQFPRGVQAESPILGWTPKSLTETNPDTVFFRPTAACVMHACDDLFKIYRNSVFEVPYRTKEEAIKNLQLNEQGMNEYQLKKTAEEIVKQDAGNYITVGLQSAFSNEPYVVPVSRFWLNQQSSQEPTTFPHGMWEAKD